MIHKYALSVTVAVASLLAPQPAALAQNAPESRAKSLPLVSPIFGDNMVLQRGKVNTIWGWSEPGAEVRVEIAGKHASAVAGVDHRWQVKIQPPAAGGPYTLNIKGAQTLELHNVLVGDVWLCGGQSNMQVGLPRTQWGRGSQGRQLPGDSLLLGCSSLRIPSYGYSGRHLESCVARNGRSSFGCRVLLCPQDPTADPCSYRSGHRCPGWNSCRGLASAEALRPLKDFDIPLAELERLATAGAPEYGNYVMHWYDQYDVGLKGNWAALDLDDSTWKPVDIPGGFAELGVPDTPALVWFRREIELPDPLPAGRASILLGSIERMDTVYINGTQIGASAWVENPRVCLIPDGVLKPVKNIVTIRVLKTKPQGGFIGKPEELHLMLGDQTSFPLAGKWKGQLSLDARPPQALPIGYENWPVMPSVLYEGMLAPIAPLSITGALSYQGEQNSDRGFQYRKILPGMIADWRKLFGQATSLSTSSACPPSAIVVIHAPMTPGRKRGSDRRSPPPACAIRAWR